MHDFSFPLSISDDIDISMKKTLPFHELPTSHHIFTNLPDMF